MVFTQVIFKLSKEGESICGCSGESGEYRTIVQLPDLLGMMLHHGLANGYLSIRTDHGVSAISEAEDCSRSEDFWHE
jgi:hypothetical protein